MRCPMGGGLICGGTSGLERVASLMRTGLWLDPRGGGTEDMAAALFLHERPDTQVRPLPGRIQFQVRLAGERRSRISVRGARLVQPAHHGGVMQIMPGIFAARYGRMQRLLRNCHPNLADVARLRSLKLSNLDLQVRLVALLGLKG